MEMFVKSRIAPTPSGYLHLGNAFNFLLTALIVDLKKGHLHLRIDDFDNSRFKRKFLEDIFVQLDWLGIEYDSGPSGPDELLTKYSQQLRNDFYFHAIEIIKEQKHIFACNCSRSQISQISPNNIYPGTCRHKNLDLKNNDFTWRVHVPQKTSTKYKTFFNSYIEIKVDKTMGDFVIKRRDGLPAYQIISLVDDIEQGVNLVVRGMDLIDSTGAQLFLAKCLKGSTFLNSKFVHHQLIKNKSGKKLSKSFGDLSLNLLKEKYQTPTFIFRETAKLLNIPFKDIFSLEDLKEAFKLSTMQQKKII